MRTVLVTEDTHVEMSSFTCHAIKPMNTRHDTAEKSIAMSGP